MVRRRTTRALQRGSTEAWFRCLGSVSAPLWNIEQQWVYTDRTVPFSNTRKNSNDLMHRQEHIQRKIDSMVTEAKEKMAKNDKKGGWWSIQVVDSSLYTKEEVV